jgi:N-methylhydantoinase A
VSDPSPLAAAYAALAARVTAVLARDGVAAPALDAALDLRYAGQSYELTVPLGLPIDPDRVAAAVDAFHAAHARRYGYAVAGEPVEAVNLRVRGYAPGAAPNLPAAPLGGADASAARVAEHGIWFDAAGPVAAAVYDRALLEPGNCFVGPALVLQYDATVVVGPGWEAQVDRFRNLWLAREAGAGSGGADMAARLPGDQAPG